MKSNLYFKSTRDPIAEAVELVISNHYNFLLSEERREMIRQDLYDQKNNIIELFMSGSSLGEISKKFKTSHNQIAYLLKLWLPHKEYEKIISKRRKEPRLDLHSQKEEIIKLYKAGIGFKKLSKQFKTDRNAIRHLVRKWLSEG